MCFGKTNFLVHTLFGLITFFFLSFFCSLLLSCRDLAHSVMQFSLQACTWRDGITTFNLRCFFISVIQLAITTNNGELREFVAKDLFNALIMSLTIDENVNNSSVLVGLCSEIFVYLSPRHPAPRQVSFFI